MRYVLPVIMILVLLGGCTYWRWGECRMVGHSVLYCIGKVVSK